MCENDPEANLSPKAILPLHFNLKVNMSILCVKV